LGLGGVLVLATDGVTECRQRNGSFLGETGLADLIAEVPNQTAEQVVAHVQRRLHELAAQHAEPDDVTLVVVRLLPGAPAEAGAAAPDVTATAAARR
jgi:serine phosphatase RsbU (regulator of sigma subunit)